MVLSLPHQPPLSRVCRCHGAEPYPILRTILPQSLSFPCRPSFVSLPTPFHPYEAGHTNHRLGFLYIGVKSQPEEHHHRHCQRILHPLVVLPLYPDIVSIKKQVPFPRRPAQFMLCLLGSAYLIKHRTHHRIHQHFKIMGRGGVSLHYPFPFPESLPKNISHLWYNYLSLPVLGEKAGQVWTQIIPLQDFQTPLSIK